MDYVFLLYYEIVTMMHVKEGCNPKEKTPNVR